MHRKLLLLAWLALTLAPAAARGQNMVTAGGFRAGLSSNPDQIVLGGQLAVGEFAPHWSFVPNLELGLGDNVQVVALNLDAYYHLRLPGSDWKPYVGGGLDVTYFSVDLPPGRPDDTHNDAGLNLVGGFVIPTRTSNQWFLELRLGVGDIPDLKIMTGMNFKM